MNDQSNKLWEEREKVRAELLEATKANVPQDVFDKKLAELEAINKQIIDHAKSIV